MILASVRLRNWKAYRQTHFTVPAPTSGRNVVVLEGDNGAGKTSLLEALTLGLYGRDGLGWVARSARNDGRPELSYDAFLERALNTSARGREARMSVGLVFEDTPAGRIGLTRAWHFSPAGRHRRDDEEILVVEGEDETIVPLPEPPERDAFLRDYLGRMLLPSHMSPFFLFDGEHVERLAGHNLETQVRTALETSLGVPLLRQLATDLRTYARERRRVIRDDADRSEEALRLQVAALETEEQSLRDRVDLVSNEINPLRDRRGDLVRHIGALHGDSYASLKAMFEQREVHVRSRLQDQEALRRALSIDLALALSGEALRSAARERLAAEARMEQWLGAQAASRAKFRDFMARLREQAPTLADGAPEAALAAAWDATWNERPVGGTDRLRHAHLGEAERHLVLRQLDDVSGAAHSAIADLARRLADTDGAVAALEAAG